jgi:Putative abortive phage resistance protein AbiGi, antitoxin
MGLSPSTLFHFTNKRGLKGILRDNFKLKYCREKILIDGAGLIGVPMVSFCDIKISEIKEHIDKYGSYGIGLSKDWAKQKGLNPVLYLNTNSPYSKGLFDSIMNLLSNKNIEESDLYSLVDTLRYSKAYEGELIHGKDKTPKYRFADEREWRYVPKINDGKKHEDFLVEDDLKNESILIRENRNLSKERLYFNANEILYIIVKEEKEIEEIINHIRAVKSEKYSLREVERLMSRIISCERIIEDF